MFSDDYPTEAELDHQYAVYQSRLPQPLPPLAEMECWGADDPEVPPYVYRGMPTMTEEGV